MKLVEYAEIPTQYGTARYVNLGFATKADELSVKTPSGAELHVKGVESDSAKAIDALSALAKSAAK